MFYKFDAGWVTWIRTTHFCLKYSSDVRTAAMPYCNGSRSVILMRRKHPYAIAWVAMRGWEARHTVEARAGSFMYDAAELSMEAVCSK